jgi:hypothetical protein
MPASFLPDLYGMAGFAENNLTPPSDCFDSEGGFYLL